LDQGPAPENSESFTLLALSDIHGADFAEESASAKHTYVLGLFSERFWLTSSERAFALHLLG